MAYTSRVFSLRDNRKLMLINPFFFKNRANVLLIA